MTTPRYLLDTSLAIEVLRGRRPDLVEPFNRHVDELAAAGTPIGGYDVLIAGHARSQGLVVVTENTREFARVAGLRHTDWTS